jgi:hypothetical protein
VDVDKEQLVEDLTRLVEEIEKLPIEKEELRRMHALVNDIEDHLEGRPTEGPQEVVDAVDQFISTFETDHPTATGIARRIMNALSSMGV